MIPVLAVPCISRPDLLRDCVASIDAEAAELIVIDNSPDGIPEIATPPAVGSRTWHRPLDNLGFSGSLNAVIKGRADLPWWMFANADAVFAPGDMARVAEQVEAHAGEPFLCGIRDFRLFGMNREMADAIGLWDENFTPMYCEDSDYTWRVRCHGGARFLMLPGDTGHVGSATIQEPRYGLRNVRTYNSNLDYYTRKWGGAPGGERFKTPFDAGGPVSAWTLDVPRVRENSWTRDGGG